jgi:glycosyltransferase involved in cell wall biosynthesis
MIQVLNFIGRLSIQGGIQTIVRQLLQRLNTNQFKSHVCTIRSQSTKEELSALGQHHWYSLGINEALTIWKHVLVMIRLRSLLKKLRPDVIHIHSGQAWYVFFSGYGLGIPYILEMHYAPGSNQVSKIIDWVEQKFARHHSVITIVHSSEVKAKTIEYLEMPPAHLVYIPLAIDFCRFHESQLDPSSWRVKFTLPDNSRIVFCAARLVAVKNFSLFLRTAQLVLKETPDVTFAIAGAGTELVMLKALSKELGIESKVLWLGPLYGTDLVDAYHASDLFLCTSDYEGFGLTLVEAMAAGKPVVSTAVGGTVDIVVEGQTGRLCPASDASALAKSVLELLNDPVKSFAWGLAGQQRARKLFDLPAFQQAMEATYRQAAALPR